MKMEIAQRQAAIRCLKTLFPSAIVSLIIEYAHDIHTLRERLNEEFIGKIAVRFPMRFVPEPLWPFLDGVECFAMIVSDGASRNIDRVTYFVQPYGYYSHRVVGPHLLSQQTILRFSYRGEQSNFYATQ